MKTLSVAVLMCCTLASVALGYDRRMRHVVEQLRSLDEIGGSAVGYGGIPHDFYLLYQYAAYASTDDDIRAMLRDEHPVVRIMGAKCALTSTFRKIDSALIDVVLNDHRNLMVGPGGCMFERMTVGQVVAQMKKDSDFLGEGVFKPRKKHAKSPLD
jgi:hypothetical protein